jgi:hypothetical protein
MTRITNPESDVPLSSGIALTSSDFPVIRLEIMRTKGIDFE